MEESSCGKLTGNCKGKGNCGAGGGCAKTSVHDWLSDIDVPAFDRFNVYEVRFKNGARKGFYKNINNLDIHIGDKVVVESSFGYDIGTITLSGELVKLQLRKKHIKSNDRLEKILRIASERELEIQKEARAKEKETMLKARVLARNLGLEMKLGEVEYQGDGKKATFYYIADQRVDFRQLIKDLAVEFRVKIEMRQIGARQEAALIGGISPSGRELCSTTWMNSYKSVSTSAARYQNLSINQTKLSGLCGRLKCCLNFELDTYLDALKKFPKKADIIETEEGKAKLVKTDILKGLMYYTYDNSGTYHPITIENVKKLLELNKSGKQPGKLTDFTVYEKSQTDDIEFVDVVGHISISSLEKTGKKSGHKNKRRKRNPKNTVSEQAKTETKGKRPKRNPKHKPDSNQK